MLIPPSYFLEKKWLRTATTTPDLLSRIGISRSTYERLWKGQGFCSPRTQRKIAAFQDDLQRELGMEGGPSLGWLTPARPWRSMLQKWLPAAVGSREHKLSYAVSVTLQIEDALYAFGQAIRNHEPIVERLPAAMGLPLEFMSEELEGRMATWASTARCATRTQFPQASFGKALLRTTLFALAAWEVAVLCAKTYVANTEPFVHKCLPKIIGGKPVLPIRMFFEAIQEHFGLKTNKELASWFEVDTREVSGSDPEESALRQIQAWKAGEIPSLETIKSLAFKLVPEDERQQQTIVLSYIKNRLVQEVYVDCAAFIDSNSQCFTNVAELVGIFQEYPEWYANHEVRYDEWVKQGGSVGRTP